VTPERIKGIRREAGLSVQDMADLLNLGPNGGDRVRDYERGRREATGPVIRLLELVERGMLTIENAFPDPF
jgi:DNA-binding transcriptional regulator YiaG